MSEEQTTSQEQSTSTEPSLETVYKQFNVEAEAATFQPQREQRTERPPETTVAVPDPVLDPNGYKAWQSQQYQSTQKSLSDLSNELQSVRMERVRAREEADIQSAVQRFRSVAGDVDPDVAEIALGQKARKDPRFMTVYQNRTKNPAAWNAAVSAYANEYKAKTMTKIDPQIAENQRAAKQSIGSQTTSKDEPTGDDKIFANKTGKEFDREWSNYVNRGY